MYLMNGFCHATLSEAAEVFQARLEFGGYIISSVTQDPPDTLEISLVDVVDPVYVVLPECEQWGHYPPLVPLTPEITVDLALLMLSLLAAAFVVRSLRGAT